MRHTFTIGDQEHAVWLARDGDGYCLHVADRTIPVAMESRADSECIIHMAGIAHPVIVAVDGDVLHVHVDGETFAVRYGDPIRKHAAAADGAADDVALAPMPGTVIAIHVRPGERVQVGQLLLVIESMKLETSIKAWRDGHVAALHVGKGDPFDRSAPLLALAPAEARER